MPDCHDEGEADRTPSGPTSITLERTEDVTDGMRVQNGPVPGAQLFPVVVATAPIILMALDRDGIITLLEGRGPGIWGVAPGALVGRSIFELAPDQPEIAAHARRTLAGETLTTPLERHGIVLETRWTPLRDDAGAVAGAIAVAMDITEHSRAEQALRESHTRQAVILNAIPDLIFRISRAGEFLDVRASQESLLFVPREAIIGHTVSELLPPEVAQASLRAIAQALGAGTPQVMEYQLPLPGGRRYFEARHVVSGPDEVLCIARDITELRRAEHARAEGEEALRQSEERFRVLIEAAPVGICVMTMQDHFATVNDAYCALTGYAREELLAGAVGDLHPPEEREAHLAQLHTRFAAGSSNPVEFTLLTKQGERRTVLGRGTTVAGASGQLQRLGFVVDISARKAMEDELRASEARFRGLVQGAPLGVCVLDERGVFEEVNGYYATLLGYQPEELVGQHFQMVYPEPLRAMANASFEQVLASGTQSMVERVLMCRDGSTRTTLESRVPLRGRDGRPQLAVCVVDIEERKAAERAVEEARALAEAMDRVSFALAGTLDPERLYQIILEQATAVLPCDNAVIFLYREGWALASAILGEPTVPAGTRLFPIIGPYRPWLATDQPGAVYLPDTDLEPAWVHVAPWEGERRIRSVISVPLCIGGEVVGAFQILSCSPQRYEARHLILAEAFGARIVQALRNVRLYAEEQRRAREAEDFAQLQSDFLGAVSHELLSPLTAIKGLAELLRTRWSALDEERRDRSLEGIAAAASRQQRLVQDLLDVSRADAEGFHCERQPFALRPVLERAAAEVQDSYHGQRVDLEGSDAVVAEGDAGRTQQILVNLIDNAAKYSPEGSPVAVSWGQEDGQVVVRVRDHGLGIPEGGRAQLFTRFVRLAGSTRRAGRSGTGLGLYLSRTLAQAMEGELDLESTGPHGSTFRLLLPGAPQA